MFDQLQGPVTRLCGAAPVLGHCQRLARVLQGSLQLRLGRLQGLHRRGALPQLLVLDRLL